MATHTRGTALDEGSKAIIFEGANMSELEVILGMDARDIKEKIHGVQAYGSRRGVPIWRLKDIISKLWRPNEEELSRKIMELSHHDLPKTLTKEFWAGQRSRQEYEIKNGDLWPTLLVIEKMSEVFKVMQMHLKLMADAVERNTELTERQRTVIKQLTDAAARDLYDEMLKQFSAQNKTDHENQEL